MGLPQQTAACWVLQGTASVCGRVRSRGASCNGRAQGWAAWQRAQPTPAAPAQLGAASRVLRYVAPLPTHPLAEPRRLASHQELGDVGVELADAEALRRGSPARQGR